MKEKLSIVHEVAGILDMYRGCSYVPGTRTKAILDIVNLMLDTDRIALLRAAIIEPATPVDIVDMMEGGK